MGIFDFVRNAGAKIFGEKSPDRDDVDVVKPLSVHLREHGIDSTNFRFRFERDGLVVMEGRVPDQDTREKAVLIVGNVEGVARVDDRLVVGVPKASPESPVLAAQTQKTPGVTPALGGSQGVAHHSAGSSSGWTSTTYTVQEGDTLSQIAKRELGDASRYVEIFEANKPMLKDPDKIFPGQVLRIPASNR